MHHRPYDPVDDLTSRRANGIDHEETARASRSGGAFVEFGTTQTVYGGTATLHYWITLNGGGVGNHKMARVDDLFVRCW